MCGDQHTNLCDRTDFNTRVCCVCFLQPAQLFCATYSGLRVQTFCGAEEVFWENIERKLKSDKIKSNYISHTVTVAMTPRVCIPKTHEVCLCIKT